MFGSSLGYLPHETMMPHSLKIGVYKPSLSVISVDHYLPGDRPPSACNSCAFRIHQLWHQCAIYWLALLMAVILPTRVCVASRVNVTAYPRGVADSFTAHSGGARDVTTAGDTTATMMTFNGGADISFPYWIAGTAFPCTTLDECTFIVNGSDTFGGDDSMHDLSFLTQPCVISDHVNVARNWFGYTGRFRMRAHGAKFYYHIMYAESDCCMKLLLYLEPQMEMLRYHMSCLQKQSILDPTSPQVITLSPNSPSSGCRVNVTSTGKRIIDCFSGRILSSDIERNWYLAISSCGSPDGLQFSHSLYVYGWESTENNYDNDCPRLAYLTGSAHHPSCYTCITSALTFVITCFITSRLIT